MGTSADQRALARTAKLRLYASDGTYVVSWHGMAYDVDDGTVTSTLSGTVEGSADDMIARLASVIADLHSMVASAVEPFPA